ncbi:hypothetical protein V8C44DRAFT_301271 [Trichoderma aethiopicum]
MFFSPFSLGRHIACQSTRRWCNKPLFFSYPPFNLLPFVLIPLMMVFSAAYKRSSVPEVKYHRPPKKQASRVLYLMSPYPLYSYFLLPLLLLFLFSSFCFVFFAYQTEFPSNMSVGGAFRKITSSHGTTIAITARKGVG